MWVFDDPRVGLENYQLLSICGQAYQQSAAVALNLAQTAGLCRDYELRENAIKLLATRGDAKAQRILGNLYFF